MAYTIQTYHHAVPAPDHDVSQDTGRIVLPPDATTEALGPAIFVGVADGIGSLAAPKVASQLAVSLFDAFFPELTKGKDPMVLLGGIISLSHRRIVEESRNHDFKRGMGTTLGLLALIKGRAYVANVGDTRTYLYRGRKLSRLTKDQAQPVRGLRGGQLVEFLGKPGNEPNPQAGAVPMQAGDVYLVCSDGLHGMLDDNELLACFQGSRTVNEIGQRLAKDLDSVGWADDVTFILLGVVPD